jgi:competence protein ComEA
MQNRMTWVLAAIAAAATLAAVGVGLNGYKNDRAAGNKPLTQNAPSDGQTEDPMTPVLGQPAVTIRIHVAGAVKKPGVYAIPSWYRVTDAVKKAGGPSTDADLDRINLADGLKDKEQLRIPSKGAATPMQAHFPTPEPPPVVRQAGGHGMGRYPFAEAARASSRSSATQVAAVTGPVNLNRATREELDTLPGVGPTTADRIIAYREQQGPFLRPEDLMNVKGIGPTRFERMRALVEAP